MSKRLSPLYRLTEEQREASEPEALAWLSASAGTGKTQVLTARVMRLLLAGVDPSSILCLTFTKAGAAEMADRIHERLAYWVRLKGPLLAKELMSLGEGYDEPAIERARKLFARVLDATGGGLRIQTIHAFSQSLLAAFPAEAGIVPGFRPLEGREEAMLARETLADMLVAAEDSGDDALIADVQSLSKRMGEDGAEGFLMRCARSPDAMAAAGVPELIEDRLHEQLGIPKGDMETSIIEWCGDDVFDIEALRRIGMANRAWGTAKTGIPSAEFVANWLAFSPEERAENLLPLREVWATKTGTLRKFSPKLIDAEPDYTQLAEGLDEAVTSLLAMRILAAFAEFAAAALRAGQRFALDYGEKKRRVGGLDFNDLIRLTGQLLNTPGMGDWVRYKLDQSLDHILVDEAQDTNANQWLIVEKLAEDFFEADPETPGLAKHRTIFAVGDFKQAIFGFQGTNPREFDAAKKRFAGHIAERKRELLDLSLDRSYRSTPPILELVDAVMENLGAEAVGLPDAFTHHLSAKQGFPGTITLLRPTTDERPDDQAEEGWVGDAKLAMAKTLAKQISGWIAEGHWLEAEGRALRPEDILILVRSRSELASLIVARLHEEGVAVAGVDRLMLTDPLAIQDLLSVLRFALQPDDDLNLASLLVSPLIGMTQDELYGLAKNRKSSLWSAYRDAFPDDEEAAAGIADILRQADLVTPYQLLETILSGPMQGRRKLLQRLGEEARDPIEELLNAALTFEQENPPSLQHFLDWFDCGTAEIKRDPAAPLDAVRVMTVHGAKGLQSPMVILADATFDPNRARGGAITLDLADGGKETPVPRPRKDEQVGKLSEAAERQKAEDREEHWRLLYVALTRAEEQLVIGGALGAYSKGEAPEDSWYNAVETAMAQFGSDWEADTHWGAARKFSGVEPASTPKRKASKERSRAPGLAKPDWLYRAAPDEERPPRPLAPSSLGSDTVTDPPPDAVMLEAATRGKLLHRLFERLPDVAADDRKAAAVHWLEHSGGVDHATTRDALIADALTVIDDATYADIFSPAALAEAPIAAVVDDVVISGTVDRLLISENRVRVIDFKTGHYVPRDPEDVPLSYIKQMAAYAAALEVIFPDKTVEAALLYSSGPKLIPVPTGQLAAHKPRFADTQESLSPLG